MDDQRSDYVGNLSSEAESIGVGSLSSPLDLRGRVLRPEIHLDFVPFLDLCIVALLFGMLKSEFVFSPGLSIDLPTSQSALVEGVSSSAVLTLRRNMVLFDGNRYSLQNLEGGLVAYLQRQSSRFPKREHVLLVKLDKNVEMQGFLSVCEIARSAGFANVQIATRSAEGARGILNEEP